MKKYSTTQKCKDFSQNWENSSRLYLCALATTETNYKIIFRELGCMLCIHLLLTCLIWPCLSLASQEPTSTVTVTIWKTSDRTVFWEVSAGKKKRSFLNVMQTQGTEILWLSDGWDPGQKAVPMYSLQAVCELLLCVSYCCVLTWDPILAALCLIEDVLLLRWAYMSSEYLQVNILFKHISSFTVLLCVSNAQI